MKISKKRKGAYAIAIALIVLFIIIVMLTISPPLKQTVMDLLTATRDIKP